MSEKKLIGTYHPIYGFLTEENCVLGEQMLFLTNDFNHVTEQHLSPYFFPNFNQSESFASIIKEIEKKHETPVLFVMYPDKESVYTDYFPLKLSNFQRPSMQLITHTNQLLSSKSSKCIDLCPVAHGFRHNCTDKLLYFRFDTHMNYFAGMLFTKEILQSIGAILNRTLTLDVTSFAWKTQRFSGDLWHSLSTNNQSYYTKYDDDLLLDTFEPKYKMLEDMPEPYHNQGRAGIITINEELCEQKLVALVFRDSFTDTCIPFLSTALYKVVYIWGHGEINEQIIREVQPDIIIIAHVERFLQFLPLHYVTAA
ncbi:MAG: hypothetical protein RLZ12_739 [Bacillota bacterium]|jgi:hypothetical protein